MAILRPGDPDPLHQEAWFHLRTPEFEGRLAWLGLRITVVDEEQGWQSLSSHTYLPAALSLRGGPAPSMADDEENLAFPYADELRQLLARLDLREQEALGDHVHHNSASAQEWQRLLRIYDENQQQHLEELLDHRLIASEHWSRQRLAASAAASWAQLISDRQRLLGLMPGDPPSHWTIGSLLELRGKLSRLADRSLATLPPQQRVHLPTPTLRQLVATLQPEAEDPSSWLWQQELSQEMVQSWVMRDADGEVWLRWLREILGISVYLDPCLSPAIFPPSARDPSAFSGPQLGSQWLARFSDLRLIPQDTPDTTSQPTYVLTTLGPVPYGQDSLSVHLQADESIAALIERLALIHRNRNLPPPRLGRRLWREAANQALNEISEEALSVHAIMHRIALQLGQVLRQVDGAWVVGWE